MSFAAPEPIVSKKEKNPKDCSKCGKHTNNARAPSWEDNMCTACYEHDLGQKDTTEHDLGQKDPLSTIVKPALVNPFKFYLDEYTVSKMRNMK